MPPTPAILVTQSSRWPGPHGRGLSPECVFPSWSLDKAFHPSKPSSTEGLGPDKSWPPACSISEDPILETAEFRKLEPFLAGFELLVAGVGPFYLLMPEIP